jgi:hypothetical protein
MADEAQVRTGLTIRKVGEASQTVLDARYSRVFTVDVSNSFGPSPGAIRVTNSGVDVDFSEFTALGLTPDLCVISNLEDTDDGNWIVVGRYDPVTNFFYPLMRVFPGEEYPLRLAPGVEEEWTGTGTMDLTTTASTLRLISNAADCAARVDAYAS